MARPMARRVIERRLAEVGRRLERLHSDLAVAEEQLAHFEEEADEARLRSLVSETAIADRNRRSTDRHAARMTRHRDGLRAEIQRLETAGVPMNPSISAAMRSVEIGEYTDYELDPFWHDRPLVFLETSRGGVKTISPSFTIMDSGA